MNRLLWPLIAFTGAAVVLAITTPGHAQDKQQWTTIKGRVQWAGDKLPDPKWIVPTNDKSHCLNANPTAKDGKIVDERLLVHPKHAGIKNVFVYLIGEEGEIPIQPQRKEMAKELVIETKSCVFNPRASILRAGQKLVILNDSPIQHHILLVGPEGFVPSTDSLHMKNTGKTVWSGLGAQRLPLVMECAIHGWMKGRLLVVNHPYATLTDENGDFEIKLAPTGRYRIMVYHEAIGYLDGAMGKQGRLVELKGDVTDLGTLKMGKN